MTSMPRFIKARYDYDDEITAEQVRLNHELVNEACEDHCDCEASRLRWVLEKLLNHRGASSSVKAIIEAALER